MRCLSFLEGKDHMGANDPGMGGAKASLVVWGSCDPPEIRGCTSWVTSREAPAVSAHLWRM